MTATVDSITLWIAGRAYRATLIGGAPDGERFVRIERDGPKPAVYDVWLGADGVYRCNCPDFTYRREGLTCEPCKHGRTVAALRLLDPEDR